MFVTHYFQSNNPPKNCFNCSHFLFIYCHKTRFLATLRRFIFIRIRFHHRQRHAKNLSLTKNKTVVENFISFGVLTTVFADFACRNKRSRCFVILVEVEKQLKLHNILLRHGLKICVEK